MTNRVITRMPADWNDTGSYALTEKGEEKYIEMICKRLPDDITWCGDELIGPVDFDVEPFDIHEIISEAMTELIKCDEPEIWDNEYL